MVSVISGTSSSNPGFSVSFFTKLLISKTSPKTPLTFLFGGLPGSSRGVVFIADIGHPVFAFRSGSSLHSYFPAEVLKILAAFALLLLAALRYLRPVSDVLSLSSSRKRTFAILMGAMVSGLVRCSLPVLGLLVGESLRKGLRLSF